MNSSTNHGVYAADALVDIASKMNLGPGGKVPVMRSTTLNKPCMSIIYPRV